jgi:hypothetical protein
MYVLVDVPLPHAAFIHRVVRSVRCQGHLRQLGVAGVASPLPFEERWSRLGAWICSSRIAWRCSEEALRLLNYLTAAQFHFI